MAAVVFPLPGPVFTMMRPRRRSDIKPNRLLYADGNDRAEEFAIGQWCNLAILKPTLTPNRAVQITKLQTTKLPTDVRRTVLASVRLDSDREYFFYGISTTRCSLG